MNENAQHNLASAAFVASFEDETVFAQALIRREGDGFLVRHLEDAQAPKDRLKRVRLEEARGLAQFTESGAFRPLKSAPNLRRGWELEARTADGLFEALNILYPGAVADWLAAQKEAAPVTNYREFTARQTGMYRIAAALPTEPAQTAVTTCCAVEFCLKRRLWTVEGIGRDGASEKSIIPCLEPCAVMLEFARKVVRWEQGIDAPDAAPEEGNDAAPECDFDAPNNPRRRRFVLEKKRRATTSAV